MIILLTLPAALLIILVFGLPIIRYLWLSLHASSVMTELNIINNNGANWTRIINDDRFWKDTFQTFRFASTSAAIFSAPSCIIVLSNSLAHETLQEG